jgi:hypothetical protein
MNSKICNRLDKELKNLKYNYFEYQVILNKTNLDLFFPILLNNIMVIVYFKIDLSYYSYPFKYPDVYINNIKYIKLLELISIQKNFTKECLCCKSICCENKWKPTFKIKDILNEIYTYASEIINFLPVDGYD